MPGVRFSPYPFLFLFVTVLYLDQLGYVNLFQKEVEVGQDFGLPKNVEHIENIQWWQNIYGHLPLRLAFFDRNFGTKCPEKKSNGNIVPDVAKTPVEEDDLYTMERIQLALFDELETWCSSANYSKHTVKSTTPEELAKLHKKEDVWNEMNTMGLVITSNFPWRPSVGLLQRLYQPYFKLTIFCGTFYPELFNDNDGFPEIITPFNYINVSEEEMYQGYFAYNCLVRAKELALEDVEGYFVMADDATFNFWHTLPLRQVFHPTGITYQGYMGIWWPSYFGKAGVERALQLITGKYRDHSKVQKMIRRYQRGLVANGKLRSAYVQLTEEDGWCISDLYFVPVSEIEYFATLMSVFFEAKVFHEIAISKFLYTVKYSRLETSEFKYLWENDRHQWPELYDEKLVLIHPIKFSFLKELYQRSQFCNSVVHTFKKSLFGAA